MQIIESFTWKGFQKDLRFLFFFSLPVICPCAYFRILSTGSAALGFFKNKLSVNDGYFSYIYLKDKGLE